MSKFVRLALLLVLTMVGALVPVLAGSASASTTAMPTGDIPGWHQIFADDFNTATTTFPGPSYSASWSSYRNTKDTTGRGYYDPSAMTVHDGMLDMNLHTVAGRTMVAAPIPLPQQNGVRSGLLYGRYAIRYKADALFGFKTEWMLWPDSGPSTQGSIDFPEGNLTSTIRAYNRKTDGTSGNALSVDTKQPNNMWHTAVVNWLPTGVTYFLDGAQIGFSPVSPSVPMHWVLQTETATNGDVPSPAEDGHVLVDWASIYTPDASNGGPTAPVAPRVPTTVTANATAGSATVAWTPPVDNGGAAITGYTVTGAPGGTCTTTTTSCTVTGLTNGNSYTFTVTATNSAGTSLPSSPSTAVTPISAPTSSSPSGAPMPVGNLPGWDQEFADDFSTDSSTFPGSYSNDWTGYNNSHDTTGLGVYAKSAITMHDGEMDMHISSVNGTPQVAAPIPMPSHNGVRSGQLYGRYAVRFRSDALYGYKTAWLLWPDDNNSQDGEIDFPEGELSGTINGFDHTVNNHPVNAMAARTGLSYTGWHTATIDWAPSGVTFYMDGVVVGQSTMSPSVSMHWVLQTETETNGHIPAASTDGHVYVDWATMYAYNPATAGASGSTMSVPSSPTSTSSAPVTSAPVTSAPVVSAPVTSAPVVSAPVTSAPVTSAPVVSAPVVSAPLPASGAVRSSTAPTTSAASRTAPQLALTVPSAAGYNSRVSVKGALTTASGVPVAGQRVVLQYRKSGTSAAFADMTSATTKVNGSVAFTTASLGYSVNVRLRYAGAAGYTAATSRTAVVAVARKVAISTSTSVRQHALLRVTGSVSPASSGSVGLEQRVGETWKLVKVANVGTRSTFSLQLKAAGKGVHVYRVIMKARGGLAASISRIASVRVV